MIRIVSWGAGIIAASLVAAAATTHVHAQLTTEHKRTFLTFSGAVQVPGATLPAGKYVFRIATPDNQMVWQVFDESERQLLASFFYVNTGIRTVQELNRADNKPIVRFYETPRGVAPALKVLYYPWDSAGYALLYPKSQAEQIAAVTHQPVLATDTDPKKSPLAHVMTIQPDAGAASQAIDTVEQSR
jgi:hypothetical protein